MSWLHKASGDDKETRVGRNHQITRDAILDRPDKNPAPLHVDAPKVSPADATCPDCKEPMKQVFTAGFSYQFRCVNLDCPAALKVAK